MEVMNRPLRRIFLGWDRPVLQSAASYFEHRFLKKSEWDLDRVLIVLPSSLAGRRLAELMAEKAHHCGWLFRPPEIVTVGSLPEKLYQARFPYASDSVQTLCWAKVLKEFPPEELQPLLVHVPDRETIKPWIDLGRMLAGLHCELATDLMLFSDVAERLRGSPEEVRWRVLAKVQRKYLDELDRLKLWDIQTARRVAIDRKEPQTDREILVLGAVDLNRAQRRFLDAVHDRVTVLVGAPEQWSDGFDRYGALQADFWQNLQVTVDPRILQVRGTVVDAANEVVRQLASLPAGTPTQEITIGVPDDEMIPILAEQLERSKVVARYGPGTPVNRSIPIQLLESICHYLDVGDYHAFASLIRVPVVSSMLRRRKGLPIDYLQQIDCYYQKTLLKSVHVPQWPNAKYRETMERVVAEIDHWLRPLCLPSQHLSDWSAPLLEVLQSAFSEITVDFDSAADSSLWEACSQVTDAIARLADIPDSIQVLASLSESVAWIQRYLDKARVAPPQNPSAIEMLGWLELSLDDAKVLVLTGIHDGTVPESVNADAFLPNELRRELGLMDNSRRYARDSYVLQTLLHAREHVSIIVHQLSLNGDPLTPSRLLLAVPPEQLGERVRWLLEPPKVDDLPSVERDWVPVEGQSKLPIPLPLKTRDPFPFSVTEFRTYVECPYRYYLKRIERLQAIDDSTTEIEANLFGILLHDCLSGLKGSVVETSCDPEAISDWLLQRLDELVTDRFGRSLRAAVQLQIEQAKQRLIAFAPIQAKRSEDGWQIYATEYPFENSDALRLGTGDEAVTIQGRVDRIDFHPRSRTWAIWDYKSADTPKSPVKQHYQKTEGWTDFQLPLYRLFVKKIPDFLPEDSILLGYIQLPKNAGQTRFEEAKFTLEQLEEAERMVLEVASEIRKGIFWEPKSENVSFWDPYAAICQTEVARPWITPRGLSEAAKRGADWWDLLEKRSARIEHSLDLDVSLDRWIADWKDAPANNLPANNLPASAPSSSTQSSSTQSSSTQSSSTQSSSTQSSSTQSSSTDDGLSMGGGEELGRSAIPEADNKIVFDGSIRQERQRDPIPVAIQLKMIKAAAEVPKDWFSPELIRASAGTGKTYKLAVRMLRLLFADQPLDHVLATTFTRKAAGEILRRVLGKLALAICESKELAQLEKDLSPLPITKDHCQYHLARLCAQLHRFRVSTLDAFYSQLAKSFSLELQLPPGWKLASEFEENQLRDQAIQRLFETHEHSKLKTLLGMLFKGESGRSVQSQIREVVHNGYKLYRVTTEECWSAFPIPPSPSDQELQFSIVQIENSRLSDERYQTARDKLLERVSSKDWAEVLDETLIKNSFQEEPKYYRTLLPSDLVDAFQSVGKYAASQELALRRAQTEASFELLRTYHEQLEIVKHIERIITFDDVAIRLAQWIREKFPSEDHPQRRESINDDSSLPSENTKIAHRQSIQFRLDARIDHLLLDEFQDTSPAQWDIIRPFAEAIARETMARGHSFFCVGDTKQAIYGWRGGVAEIFDAVQSQMESIQTIELSQSYRSSVEIVHFVNRVFENLDRHSNFGEGANAIGKWKITFPKHQTAKVGLPGYIQLVNGPGKRNVKGEDHGDEEETEVDLMMKAANDLTGLAQAAPHISIGVLVRRNRDVAKMIHLLRGHGIDASQEGGNPLTDSAAVELLLSLLQLADHPGDGIAAFHLARSPLAPRLGFRPRKEMDRLAESVRKRFQENGYGRATSHYANLLAPFCNARDQQRLEQLNQLAYTYDPNASDRISDFVRFVQKERVALPTPSQVRVMTVHQSKGLEFDAVFLPDLDQQIRGSAPLFVPRTPDRTKNPTGIIRHFNKALREYITDSWKNVFEEIAKQQLTEALCVFYVALTRARQALYLYSTAHDKPANRWGSVLHSILVDNPTERAESDRLLYRQGDPDWYRLPDAKNAATHSSKSKEIDPMTLGGQLETLPSKNVLRLHLKAVDPSAPIRHRPATKPSAAGESRRASLSKALEPTGSVGAIFGTLIHRWFEEIVWLDDFHWDRRAMQALSLKTLSPEEMTHIQIEHCLDEMERMLRLQSVGNSLSRRRYVSWMSKGIDSLEVSNERRLMEILDECLLRGTIDRLVIGRKKDKVVRAEIIDFKTDSIDLASSEQSWLKERAEHHRSQLELYRKVLCKQFSIAEIQVDLTLVMLSADRTLSLNHPDGVRIDSPHAMLVENDSETLVKKQPTQLTFDF